MLPRGTFVHSPNNTRRCCHSPGVEVKSALPNHHQMIFLAVLVATFLRCCPNFLHFSEPQVECRHTVQKFKPGGLTKGTSLHEAGGARHAWKKNLPGQLSCIPPALPFFPRAQKERASQFFFTLGSAHTHCFNNPGNKC